MALTYSLQRSQGYPSYPPAQRLTGGTLPQTALVPISLMPATFLPLHPIMQSSFFPFVPLPFILGPIMHPRNNQQTSLANYYFYYFYLLFIHTLLSISPNLLICIFYRIGYCVNVQSSNQLDITLSHFCFKGEQETRLLLTLTKATLLLHTHTHTHTHTLYTLTTPPLRPPFRPPLKAVLKKRHGCLKSFLGNWDETKMQHRLTQSCPGRCFNSRNN